MKKALIWKFLERIGVQGIQFVLQVVLARLLDPEHYGVLSLMIIFTTLANVFIQNGFNTALIQNKDVTEDDYSSAFWVSVAIAAVIYTVLFFAAPFIAAFYKVPDLVKPFRVLCLILFPGAWNSIQLAKVSRNMDFKKVFYSNIGGYVIAGVVGIVVALLGGGLWALVAQALLNVLAACVVMAFTVRWRPRMVCNLARVGVLFSFGWKILVSTLLDTLYQDIRSLVIGKKYTADMLGYYNRGKQFPQLITNSINGTLQSVLLPAMSAEQDKKENVKTLMRNTVIMGSFLLFPMMAGLAGVATPLVRLLLTDKWLPCVPFLQTYCFILAFRPVHSSNLQAINAMGRSDIFLKLEIIKKSVGIVTLVIAVFCFDSPVAIAMTGAITTIASCFINAYPSKKLIGYSYMEQVKDFLPALVVSLVMCAVVLTIGRLSLAPVWTLLIQMAVGVTVYVGISAVFRLKAFLQLMKMLKAEKQKLRQQG